MQGDAKTLTGPAARDDGAYFDSGTRLDLEDARIVKLLVTKPDGGSMEAELLRGQGWIEQHCATVGEHVFLNLPELGIETEALVIAIEEGPELDEEGEADSMPQVEIGGTRFRRVTGRFRHSSGELLLLQLVGAAEPIRITAGHLIWSDTARDWVAVSELRIGDRLRTLDGPGIVESITPCPTPQPVYNLEIDGDHVYRIGPEGTLVHNTSLYRGMREGSSGKPEIGPSARTLGVREDGSDITINGENVEPNTGGMSVAPDDPKNLPAHRRPADLGGTGKDPVWLIDSNQTIGPLVYDQDRPDHGTIQPSCKMSLADFQKALAQTVTYWRKHSR